jgi:hypothetical protein
MLFFASLVLLVGGIRAWKPSSAPDIQSTPAEQSITPAEVRIIPQRLQVVYWGQDGSTLIGSGCPGNDGKGTLIDYHFTVNGVDTGKDVTRIVVAGNNSTVTWANPCSNTWGLYSINQGAGRWELYVAPSEPTSIYTVVFFYADNSMALGMVEVN